jgi:hypothetical protein
LVFPHDGALITGASLYYLNLGDYVNESYATNLRSKMSLPSSTDDNPIIEGSYYASRSAWLAARTEAHTALDKMKALISKTKDPRASQVGAALDRIIRRIPDAGAALEALADAEDSGGDAAALKDNARKTVQLASYYLRSDRLAAMIRDNPFYAVSVDKIYSRALQNIQRELK